MATYYNEFDPFAAAWLRELIADGQIPRGEVDERSIVDVQPGELAGFEQCHFFAGIGGWAYALRLAGWPDDRHVWTGSCPCQPFSVAGKGEGFDDSRHLWPAWFRLIRECRPPVLFGEQVASTDGLAWLDTVSTDLEGEGYAVGASDLCAAGVGAPTIRQRLWFVADSDGGITSDRGLQRGWEQRQLAQDGGAVRMADSERSKRRQDGQRGDVSQGWEQASAEPGGDSPTGGLADAENERHEWTGSARRRRRGPENGRQLGDTDEPRSQGWIVRLGERSSERAVGSAGNSFWSDAIWLPCTDGKARPTQPGIFPLATGVPGRVGLLRGAGNSIVPQVGAAFIEAVVEALREQADAK